MRAADWKRITRSTLGAQWRTVRQLAYLTPVGWVLYGLLAETSAATGGVYLWRVRMPLYVPTDFVILDWSDRVGGGTRVYLDKDDLAAAVREAAPQVEAEAQSLSPVVNASGHGPMTEPMQETHAYGLVLEGDIDQAVEILGQVAHTEPRHAWIQEMINRANESRSILQNGHVEQLRQRLTEWRRETLVALKISPDEPVARTTW